MRNIFGIMLGLVLILICGNVQADSDSPSPFALTYLEFYGTPVQPLTYAQNVTDALGFDVLGEYNPSYYASFGIDFEKTHFYDMLNTNVSFLGLEARFFGAPNGKSPFAPYIFGGAGLGLNTGTGNELKAGLGSRLQLAYPIFLDFSAGSNWIDSGLQYLTFRGGISASFDLPKVESAPTAKPTKSATVEVSPAMTASPIGTLTDILATPSPTVTVAVPTNTPTVAITSTPTQLATATMTLTPGFTETETPSSIQSRVKLHYKAGMKAYEDHHYLTAISEFKKALTIKDPTVQSYYYAESNAMLGVVYQFNSKIKGHNDIAISYYKRALKVDPMTKSAKKYLKMLLDERKATVTAKPTASNEVVGDATATSNATVSSTTSAPQAQASPVATSAN